ncbi:MAG: tRNA epoxyqueuosine(34) reductase QueG [Gemmatimonadetes bacterium]|nr:tRNA epoxyqueuosine(34) reductase QueG [Gemmatimonadota bacterium]
MFVGDQCNSKVCQYITIGAMTAKVDFGQSLEQIMESLGFDFYGFANVDPSSHMDFYVDWLDQGYHGDMWYLERANSTDRRCDLKKTMPSVQTALVVAQNYFQDDDIDHREDDSRAIFARYARGKDYHQIITQKLKTLHVWVNEQIGREVDAMVYVDTGPILERELAQRAGMGWFGKNTMLINPRKGSFFFLGLMLMDLDVLVDKPFLEDHCGSCTSCLDSCPTDALLGRDENGAPIMDARKCISYLTIERRGSIPLELRSKMGNRVYGCDICQEVCPWNIKFSVSTPEPALRTGAEIDGPALMNLAEDLTQMDDEAFRSRFGGSPIKRAQRKGLLRNVCVAMGNWGSQECIPVLKRVLFDPEPLVREHAAWALEQINSKNED